MRQFVAGAVIGSAVTLIGALVWTHNTAIPTARSASPIADCASTDVVEVPAASSLLSGHGETRSQECIAITESNMDAVAAMLESRIRERHERSLRDEPKDPLWAPGVEQQIRMLLAQDPLSAKFNLASVDCRTVYCEIKAEVPPGPEAVDGIGAFHKVTEAMRSSVGLHQGGSGSGGQLPNGMIDAHATFRRYSIEDTCPPAYPNCWNR